MVAVGATRRKPMMTTNEILTKIKNSVWNPGTVFFKDTDKGVTSVHELFICSTEGRRLAILIGPHPRPAIIDQLADHAFVVF